MAAHIAPKPSMLPSITAPKNAPIETKKPASTSGVLHNVTGFIAITRNVSK